MASKSLNDANRHHTRRVPWHLWVIGIVFLLLYVMGIYDYFMMLSHNERYYASMGFDQAVHQYFADYPLPFLLLWTVNIFSAPVAALLLLLRRRSAARVALICALAIVTLQILTFTLRDRWNVLGPEIALFDLIVVAGSTIAFYAYTRMLQRRGVLR